MTTVELKDFRCRGLPDKPYSSYCQVCWHPIYTLWFSKEDHQGVCMHGMKNAVDCEEARSRDSAAIAFEKLRDQGLIK